jgi:hypothetical protein
MQGDSKGSVALDPNEVSRRGDQDVVGEDRLVLPMCTGVSTQIHALGATVTIPELDLEVVHPGRIAPQADLAFLLRELVLLHQGLYGNNSQFTIGLENVSALPVRVWNQSLTLLVDHAVRVPKCSSVPKHATKYATVFRRTGTVVSTGHGTWVAIGCKRYLVLLAFCAKNQARCGHEDDFSGRHAIQLL